MNVKPSKKVLERLIQDLKVMSSLPMGEHLKDLDYAFYADGLLSDEDVERVERHLQCCLECAVEMEKYVVWCDEQKRKEALESWRKSQTLNGVTALPEPAKKEPSPDAEGRLAKLQKAVEDFLAKANTTPPWESAGAVWGQMCKDLNIARLDSLQAGESEGKKP